VKLPATLIFDHPTPQAAADFVWAQLVEHSTQVALQEDNSGGAGAFTELLIVAHREDRVGEALGLLAAASKFRPTFEHPSEVTGLERAITLAKGEESPQLVCIPSFATGMGPHQYLRLAKVFDGRRTVSVVLEPGLRTGELLPATWDVAISAMADTVRRSVDSDEIVLLGYSIGGAVAYAVAEKLESQGVNPAGVAFIDSYWPTPEGLGQAMGAVMTYFVGHANAEVFNEDDHLIGMGGYLRMLGEWEPGVVKAPSLLVQVDQILYEGSENERWTIVDTTVQVESDHFSIIEGDVGLAADAIDEWLTNGQAGAGVLMSSDKQGV
jgi:pimeloyl-ACP methyl ester carboxylesterase